MEKWLSQKSALLALSIFAGLAGTVLLYRHNSQRDHILADTVQVVAACGKIRAFETVPLKKFRICSVPAAFVPRGAVLAREMASLKGQKTAVGVDSGQIFLWNYLQSSMAGSGLSARLKEGTRAMTVRVDKVSGLENMLVPGNRLDALATFTMPDGKKRRITRTLLQNLFVVAVGNDERKGGAYSTVTLQVLPREAELLAFAEEAADLRFILRSDRDLEITGRPGCVDFETFNQARQEVNGGGYE